MKEQDKIPEEELGKGKISNLPNKEFKIAVRKKFSELQENSERLYNDLRNKINKIIYQRG